MADTNTNYDSLLDGNGLLYVWNKIKGLFATKQELQDSKVTVENNLSSDSEKNALSAKQGKVLDEKIAAINTNIGNLGGGDMLKSVYDTNNNGKVDDAEKLGGNTPDYYAPASALNDYVPNAKVGQASGVASLGADGKVPESQLPETAPIEHKHEMSDINGLADALNGKADASALEAKANASDLEAKADVEDLEEAVEDMTEIANGKCACYVYDTVEALEEALKDTAFTATLKTGDVFLIRAVDVPDYWWDGNTSTKQVLETTKVELSVLQNTEIDTILGITTA